MSNKTIFKRIALTAVSALAAGTLSVVATPAANATNTDDGYISSTAGSIGLVAAGTLASNTADTTKTGVILSTGTLVLRVQSTDGATLVVGAGASIINTSGALSTITADQTCVALADAATASIRPTGVAGSTFTVSVYSENACADSASLTERAVVTIAGTDLSGVSVPANARINWTTDNTVATTESVANTSTTTGNPLFLYINLRDAYLANVTSTSGALIVTASAGANVVIGAGALATNGTTGTAVSALSPAALYVRVSEATAGAGWNGTVTVSYNGVVQATKAGKISGVPTKLTVAALKIGKNDGAANAAALAYQVNDAAGNNIVVPFANIVYSSSSNTTLVSAAAGSVVNTTSDPGLATFTCANSTSLVGTADIVLQTTLSNGTIIKSNAVKVTCGGAATSYTASWDKASYAQGDIAKLTIQFRDAKGAVANSYDDLGAAANQVITANQMERVTAHATTPEADANGQLVYTFTVGTSSGIVPGKYNAVISFPTVNTAGATAGVSTGNASASYEITAPASVSNAEVLASIVKLIATINKQIRALQKQLRR